MAESDMGKKLRERASEVLYWIKPCIELMIQRSAIEYPRLHVLVVYKTDEVCHDGTHYWVLAKHRLGAHQTPNTEIRTDAHNKAEAWATSGNGGSGVASSGSLAVITVGTHSAINSAISGAILSLLGGLIASELELPMPVTTGS